MSYTRYVITNQTALDLALESLEHQYIDDPTFQEALRQYRKEKNIDLLAKLLSSYELEIACIGIDINDEIIAPAKREGFKNLSLFQQALPPLTESDSSRLLSEEILKIMQFD